MTVRHKPMTRTSEAVRRLEEVGALLGEQLARLRPVLDNRKDGHLSPEAEAALDRAMKSLRGKLQRPPASPRE